MVWTIVVAGLLIWYIVQVKQNTLESARIQARVACEKDIIYRTWAVEQGSLYIEVTDSLEPDPYLSMPESDIVTPSGRLLRYVHPVSMTRIVNKLARERFGVLGKITSFKPVHPENMPDTWEREALQAFEQRKSEVSSVQDIGGNAYMRLMRPLLIEKACLQCHTGKEGDVCGGIGVSIPMQPLWAIERKVLLQLSLSYGAIWLMGLWGLVLVTRRLRRSQEKVLHSKRFTENIVATVPSGLLVISGESEVLSVNRSFCELFNVKRQQVVGQTVDAALQTIGLLQQCRDAIGARMPFRNLECMCSIPGKAELTLNLTLSGIRIAEEEEEEEEEALLVIEDITDRKNQEQIQKILYNISQATVTTDSFEVFIAEIQKQLGSIIDTTNFYIAFYDASTDTISMPFMADQKDRFTTYPAAKTMTRYMMESQKPLLATKDDMLALQKSGHIDIHGTLSEIWLGVPLKSQGKVTGAVVVQSYEDPDAYGKPEMTILEFISNQISLSIERRKAEEEIKAALEKAQESDRLKSAFLANMSHEIRTPLNSVLGFSELISDPETEPSEREKYSKIILNSGQQLLAIISDVLDISKIEAGQILITRNPFNLQHLLEEVKEEFEPKANLNGLNLMIDSRLIKAELVLISDREKIKQILSNLVGNAIKFTNQGSIIIGLYQNGTDIQFYIEDTGIGIRKENYETVFERFRQVNSEKNRKYEGTGLGLAIAKSLVEMLGGRIWVESAPGTGSTFYFTIPSLGDMPID
ncbi:MAG: ATP-binding protein [Bacteroidales bacterium]